MLTPNLPESVTFTQSGTPLEAIAETTYTLTATDSNGDAATLMFTRSVMTDPMPTFGDATVAAQKLSRQSRDRIPDATASDRWRWDVGLYPATVPPS